jgi:4-hydroxy-tetrahydrodipicolinate reductase
MGRLLVAGVLEAPDLALAAAIDVRDQGRDAGELAGAEACGVAISGLDDPALDSCSIVIDFSLPEGTRSLLARLRNQALVVGTTGMDAAIRAALEDHATRAPVVAAANFSTGITLLLDLVARAASTLGEAEIAIVETHHAHKKDAPSGTALALSGAVTQGTGREVAIESIRTGEVVGEHRVSFSTRGERLDLTHVADSREAFVTGALTAARWVAGKAPGLYRMNEVLGLV